MTLKQKTMDDQQTPEEAAAEAPQATGAEDGATAAEELPGKGGEVPDEAAEPAEPALEERLREAEARAEANRDEALRARAEMENLRKRFARDMEKVQKFAIESFARDLLPVVDNMDRALAHMGQAEEGQGSLKAMMEGVEMVRASLLKALEKHGVTRIEALNAPFDHNLHQAVRQVPDSDAEDNTVVEELQAGYMLKDRLLRPAMVGVAS